MHRADRNPQKNYINEEGDDNSESNSKIQYYVEISAYITVEENIG